MLVQEPVHSAIWHCLNHYAYDDATFLAERLFTEVASDESLFLLATCYFRNGQLHQAYDILTKHDSKLPENRFLLGKCCVKLDKIHEAELALVSDILDIKTKDSCDDVVTSFKDIASFALQMLAQIYSKTERLSKANEADKRALKLNPMLWKSFESLCQRGDFPDPETIFNADIIEDIDQCSGSNHVLNYANKICQRDLPSAPAPPQQSSSNSASNLPQPRMSLLQTPAISSRGSSTSTPILPISNVQALQSSNLQAPVIFVTPLSEVGGSMDHVNDTVDSCFTASPGSAAAPNYQLTMSGIGMLSFNSDMEKSTMATDSTSKASMPPPPIRPKPLSRIVSANFALNDSDSMTPPSSSADNKASGGNEDQTFGRFPRGALVWSSGGKPENVASSLMAGKDLVGSRLDFSPLGVLSPQMNPSTPLGNLQTPKASSQATMSENNQPQQTPTSASPLINATNSELKMKRSQNENSTPLKQSLFGQSSQNQNTPANNHVGGNVRRSSRLFGSSQQQSIKAKENTKTPAGQNVSPKGARGFKSPSKKGSKSGNRPHNRHNVGQDALAEMNEKNKLMDVEQSVYETRLGQLEDLSCIDAKAKEHALSLQKHSLEGLMGLLKQLGLAYVALSRFQCQKAIESLDKIDPRHRNTAWVMGSIGKAHFEMGDYQRARKCFQQMRDLDPHRSEFTEYFSTALWHLQEEVELSALAQDLTSTDKMSPQAWCSAGNCFSLQKEHENAIKFFQRASQVDPGFAYAYTLLGHEYITIEELDKALGCFRTAVRIDPRHYNAWYGIGLVFYKQERFQLAEIYYRKTVEINPQSPVLMCHLAVVQHALQKTDKALETLDIALLRAPQNPLCKFERASILFSIERFDEALVELNQLKVLVPKESPVYFLMGKVHNKLNNTHLALMHFSWAMDLDPKGANSQIKDALDRSMNKAAQDTNEILPTQIAYGDPPLLEFDEDDDDDDDEEMQDGSAIV